MRKLRTFLLRVSVLVAIAGSVELAGNLGNPDAAGLVGKAEARVGRPLTPVSVAGVGRRTVRRCAAGVYNC
jgi:hypothetical protein